MQSRAEPPNTGTTSRAIVACANHLPHEFRRNLRLGQGQLRHLVGKVEQRRDQLLPPLRGSSATSGGIGPRVTASPGRRPARASSLGGNVSSSIVTRSTSPRKGSLTCGGPMPSGHLQHQRLGPQPLFDLLDRAEEVGPLAVELVDQRQPGHAVAVGLPPDRLALGLDALAGAEHDHRPVEHPQAPLHLGREVDVAGRVDQVHRHVVPSGRKRPPSRS